MAVYSLGCREDEERQAAFYCKEATQKRQPVLPMVPF